MTHAIITYHHAYLDETARLYEQAYVVKPIEGRTGFDVSREVLVDYTLRESFLGVLAVNEFQEVIGAVWGYDTPAHNQRITRIVAKRMGQKWIENTFMVEVFAMHFEHQGAALAADLLDGLSKRAREAGYERLRIRVNLPRIDQLPKLLDGRGWERLQALSHVIWMGKTLDPAPNDGTKEA